MNNLNLFWQTYLNLEKEALELSKYIFFTDVEFKKENKKIVPSKDDSQLKTYSTYIADLLVRCCIEIEAISKELYKRIKKSEPENNKHLYFDTDCLDEINEKWHINDKIVIINSPNFVFEYEENKILTPLKNANKKGKPYWKKAYQAVKHDRYENLNKGNVKAFLHALAALYLLNIYYRNDSWITSYSQIKEHDYSMGSSIFSVLPPEVEAIWYNNNPIESSSPYIAVYEEEDYAEIQKLQIEINEKAQSFLDKQPEMEDSEFLKIIEEDRYSIVTFMKLGQYRLNKKLPENLSFKERKEKLLFSEEWKCSINQNNSHLISEQITEENIQNEIDSTGTRWGLELFKRLYPFAWISAAFNKKICKISIPS